MCSLPVTYKSQDIGTTPDSVLHTPIPKQRQEQDHIVLARSTQALPVGAQAPKQGKSLLSFNAAHLLAIFPACPGPAASHHSPEVGQSLLLAWHWPLSHPSVREPAHTHNTLLYLPILFGTWESQ